MCKIWNCILRRVRDGRPGLNLTKKKATQEQKPPKNDPEYPENFDYNLRKFVKQNLLQLYCFPKFVSIK